jgi:hypothetical protein
MSEKLLPHCRHDVSQRRGRDRALGCMGQGLHLVVLRVVRQTGGKAGEGAVGPPRNAHEGKVGRRAAMGAQGDQLQLLPPCHQAVLGMRLCGDYPPHSAARAFLDLAERVHGGGPPELSDQDGQRDQGAEPVGRSGELPTGSGMAAFLRSAGSQNREGGRNDL